MTRAKSRRRRAMARERAALPSPTFPELATVDPVALAPIISGIIEVAKKLGLDVKYAPWLNAALSVLAFGLIVIIFPLFLIIII